MLEGVTLAQVVQFMVQVLVNLAGSTVADEETAENTHTAHPEDLAVLQQPISKTITSQQFVFVHRLVTAQ